jgi:hypothetical protein
MEDDQACEGGVCDLLAAVRGPVAKRLWTHRKAGPPLLREQPTGRREQGAVDGRVPGPLPSSPEDRELVTQGDELKLPLATSAGEHPNDHAQEPVQHTHQQDAQSEAPRLRSPARLPRSNRVSLPHTRARGGPSSHGAEVCSSRSVFLTVVNGRAILLRNHRDSRAPEGLCRRRRGHCGPLTTVLSRRD